MPINMQSMEWELPQIAFQTSHETTANTQMEQYSHLNTIDR